MDGKVLSKYVLGWGLSIILFFFIGLRDVDSKDNPGSNEKYTPYKSNYALVIGIGNYHEENKHQESYKDAAIVGKQLHDMGFTVTYLWDVGFDELKDRLSRFFKDNEIEKDSGLFIWYSGHIDKDGFYLIPADEPQGENDPSFETKMFLVKDFLELSKGTKAKYVYMVFDACISSKVLGEERSDSPKILPASMLKYPVRQYLCSCSAGQETRKDGSFRDMFIKVLRNELNANANGDNYLTASEIGAFIKKEMVTLHGETCTPYFGKSKDSDFDKGEFLFLRQSNIPAYYSPKYFSDRLDDKSKGPEMSIIPSGFFMMGDLQGGGFKDEKPVHGVSVSSIAVSRNEVTFEEYDRYCGAKNPNNDLQKEPKKPLDNGWGRGKRPVINVSWEDAVAYTDWLSKQTGFTYRLPTEAEWEYFARAGTETDYYWNNEVGYGNANCTGCGSRLDVDAKDKTAPVGAYKLPNAFGIFDTVGNVWEWTCSEYTDEYNDGSKKETKCLGEVATGGETVVLRGGSWDDEFKKCRVSHRKAGYPGERSPFIGFRVVRELK